MVLVMKDEGPFTGVLVDLIDCCNQSPGGLKYDCGADGRFNAEEAIWDVFGDNIGRPTGFDPPASSFPNGVVPVPKPPTQSPAHIFRGDGGASSGAKNNPQQSIEAPHTMEIPTGAKSRFAQQKSSNGSFGNPHNKFSHGPSSPASSSPFKHQFRGGGFGGPTSKNNGFGGRAHGANSSGFGAPFNSGPSTRGFGEPHKNLVSASPSGDCSGFGCQPGGFGGHSGGDGFGSPKRASGRSGRGGRGSGRGSSRRTGKRRGRGRDRISHVGFSMDKKVPREEHIKDTVVPPEEPKAKAEVPSDFGAKRTAQNFGGNRLPTAKTVPKRRRMRCRSCGRPGHLAPSCYTQLKKIRCYNCNEMGHLAVRCPLPRKPHRGRPRPCLSSSSTFAETATKTATSASNETVAPKVEGGAAQANNHNTDVVGARLMCKLMQDAEIRQVMQNALPNLHDDLLVYMIKQLQM